MSWFSNSFTTSFRSTEAHQNDSDGDEEDEHTHGKGVKEDLSELTRTFSRQLWGVASFLAPPPPPPQDKQNNSSSNDGDDEASMIPAKLQNESSDDGHYEASTASHRHHSHIAASMASPSIADGDDEASMSHPKPGCHRLITEEGAASSADEEPSLHRSHIEQGNRRLLTEEMELSEELVDVDFEVFMDETPEGPAGTLKGQDLNQIERVKLPESSSHLLQHQSLDLSGQNAAHSLTGISRDLAELKGSVASSFSKILRVVREEAGQEETYKSHKDDSDEEEEIANDPTGSTHARKLQGINMFFRPLFSNILHDDGVKNRVDASSDNDEEEPYDDGPGQDETSSHARVFKLQDTFIDGFKGISEFASSLISVSLNSDDKEEAWERERNSKVVGITEEVLAFARNISTHPETWLDFPLFAYANDDDEFEMSVAQKDHVQALELAIPRLAVLRTELCPDCMSEGSFWKIYFVLLHSRLRKVDAVILSTPKIMEARVRLLQKLQEGEEQEIRTERREFSTSKGKDALGMASSISLQQSASEVHANDFGQLEDVETDSAEEVQNKSVLVNTVKLATSTYKGEETDADQRLHEEPLPHVHSATLGLTNEEDVSFSDLEEDNEPTSRIVERSDSTQSFGWVQLSKNQSEEDFEGLRASEKAELQGYRHGDVGSRELFGNSSAQPSRKHDQSESSDWSTVEEDDVASADFM